jgi:hypothetical protein
LRRRSGSRTGPRIPRTLLHGGVRCPGPPRPLRRATGATRTSPANPNRIGRRRAPFPGPRRRARVRRHLNTVRVRQAARLATVRATVRRRNDRRSRPPARRAPDRAGNRPGLPGRAEGGGNPFPALTSVLHGPADLLRGIGRPRFTRRADERIVPGFGQRSDASGDARRSFDFAQSAGGLTPTPCVTFFASPAARA